MTILFSDDMRRDPHPTYRELRSRAPIVFVPPPIDAWMIFDYDLVRRALTDHKTFSSRVPGPKNWFIFYDPPAHGMMRALLSRAFTPQIVASFAQRIEDRSRELLDGAIRRGEMDVASDFSVPLAMQTIAGIIGIPPADWPRYKRWSDTILGPSAIRTGGDGAERALQDFAHVTAEMSAYLADAIEQRRSRPLPDLLTSLIQAEVDGERLFHEEILGFLQLLVIGGQETSSDLINNAVLCLLDHPEQLARLRAAPDLMQSAVEEVLRYRSPTQWITRVARRTVALHGVTIPEGGFVVPVIGAANRDPTQFTQPDRFDIGRHPNPHVAFGHGVHFCLGAALARMEARVALTQLLQRAAYFERASELPWEPRAPLQLHGPASLPIRFAPGRRA